MDNFADEFEVLLDRACGGKQNIPLFFSRKKSRAIEICNVDILVLKSDRIKVIFEIEETDMKPTQICGKFLTSSLASYYITRNNKAYGMDKSLLFIQILDMSKIKKDKTSKIGQWMNIEKAIKDILPIKNSNIDNYKLIYGDISDFGFKGKRKDELIGCLRSYLSGSL